MRARMVPATEFWIRIWLALFDTDMAQLLPPEVRERALTAIPLARLGTPADIAHACLFLASEEAGYITGETMDVNGGALMD